MLKPKMKRRMKKFADGGYTEDAALEGMNEARAKYDADAAESDMPESNALPAASRAAAKVASFGDAFSAARKGGAKTFEYKGKSYTTEMAKPTAKAAPRAAARADTSSDAAEMARLSRSKAPVAAAAPAAKVASRRSVNVKDIMPTEEEIASASNYIPGAGAGRTLAAAAPRIGSTVRQLANEPTLKRYAQEALGGGRRGLPEPTRALQAPPRGLPAPKAKPETTAPKREPTRAETRNRRLGDEFDEGVEFKRGGKIKAYATGGKIDGCAVKGKTKGRMV